MLALIYKIHQGLGLLARDVDKEGEREMGEERKLIKKFPSGHISRASKCIPPSLRRSLAPLEKDAADRVG